MCHFLLPRRRRAALVGGVFFFATFLAWPVAAQNVEVARDQARLSQQAGASTQPADDETGTESEHAVASPNDPDLGEQAILKRAEHYQAFTFYAAAPYSYTSNVALVRTGEQGDGLFTPALGITYTPRLAKTLYANFGVAQQWFFYNKFDALDFASFDARAGLAYTIPQWHNLLLRLDYDFNRLTAEGLNNEFFTNHALDLGAEVPFRIGRAQQVSVGGDLNFSLAASPSAPARHEYSAFVGYSANLTRNLTLGAVGRLAVRDYVEGSRTDVGGVLALSATYRFSKWLNASAITTVATNDSNQDVFDYTVVNVGGALSLNVRF